jgi:hypothetical protein
MRSSLTTVALLATIHLLLPAGARAVDAVSPPPIEPFRYVAIADPHFFNRDRNPYFLDRFRVMLEKSISLGADFVVILGDIVGVEPPEQVFPEVKAIIDASEIPVHLVRGNHEYPDLYRAAFGSSDYSFDHKGWRFVAMDESYHLKIHPIPAAITDAPKGMPIAIWRHYTGYYEELDKLLDSDVKLWMGGHIHSYSNILYKDKIRRMVLDDFHGTQFYTIVDVAADGTFRTSNANLLPLVRVWASDATATESAGNTGTFTISRTGGLDEPLIVNTRMGGTATPGTDYARLSTSAITIPSGAGSVNVTIAPVDDASAEGTETAVMSLSSSPSTYLMLNASATIAIFDDEPVPVVGLAVTPATGMSSSGVVGGPFAASSQNFILTNTSATVLNWTVRKAASAYWLTLSSLGGSLAAGSSVTVTASLNTAADGLAAGSYSETLTFTNATTNAGTTARLISLTVSPRPTATADTTPPAGIADLAPRNLSQTSVELAWTAPGDDGDAGAASAYDLRSGTSAIMASTFASATPAAGLPAPALAGTKQSATLAGLAPGTTYTAAIKARDEVSNWSGISNIVTFRTLDAVSGDTTAPVISALGGSGSTATGITLSWSTSELADGRVDYGTSSAYGLSSALVDAAPNLTKTHRVTLMGLAPRTVYHFRITSRDAAGNAAASNDHVFSTPASSETSVLSIRISEAESTTAAGADSDGPRGGCGIGSGLGLAALGLLARRLLRR